LLVVNERLLLTALRDQELADQLRQQLSLTSAIADSLSEGICSLDHALQITFANVEAARLLGWAESELIGQGWDDVAGDRNANRHALMTAIDAGATYHNESDLFTRRDGSTFAVAYTVAPIVAGATVAGTVVHFRDITARKHAEAASVALLARVEAALAFHSRFLSITTHELKTPLTVLRLEAQLLLRRAEHQGDDARRGALARIDQQVDRMTRLIDDLGDVARVESKGLGFDLRPLDLAALLAEIIAEVGIAAPTFTLRLDTPAGEVWIHGDRVRLQQVLVNLLTNAVKYSGHSREVGITLQLEGTRATIAITDHGIGIPAAQQVAVFEPYVRGTNAPADAPGGMGLGLFISKTIVDRHGGTITLASEEGRGSTFSLSLPLLLPENDASDD